MRLPSPGNLLWLDTDASRIVPIAVRGFGGFVECQIPLY